MPGPSQAPSAVLELENFLPYRLSILAQLLGYHPDKIRKFAFKFLQTTEAGFNEMEEALAANDVQKVRELGHRIKSSARAVGAVSFAELCLQLEHLAPEDDIATAREIVLRMQSLLEKLKEHIAQEMNANVPG